MKTRKRLSYNARVFPCPYNCNTYCRSAGGLTQHRAVCSRNPANCRAGTSTPPPDPTIWPPPNLTPPATGGPSPPATPFAPPAPQTPRRSSRPLSPGSGSPHQHQWTTSGRGVKTREHPYLNGQFSDALSCCVADINRYRAAL
jgi:hypothetical protein